MDIMSNTNRISSSTIKSMVAGESITLSGADRSEVVNIVNAVSNKNVGYEYTVTKNKRGEVIVKRVVPENMYNRAQYIASINKKTFTRILKQNDFVKTRTGEALGVSARTVGRLMQRYGV
jgi:transcriptional regulator with GAF, ATPase, and Fis domain